jgi:hypothetical protein
LSKHCMIPGNNLDLNPLQWILEVENAMPKSGAGQIYGREPIYQNETHFSSVTIHHYCIALKCISKYLGQATQVQQWSC